MPTLRLPPLDIPEPAVSGFELSRYIAGELDAERRSAIAGLLASDAALKARHDALVDEQRAADAALRLEVPLERFLAEHESRVTAHASGFASVVAALLAPLKSLRVQAGLGAVVAAAAVIIVVTRPPSDGRAGGNGIKGGEASVGFFVRDGHNAHFGHEGERLGAGDQIQFAVREHAAHNAMVLVGVDGRGEVTVYDAEDVAGRAKGPAPAADDKPRLLPDSVVLDDSTGPERFFVVYGDGDVAAVRARVEKAAQELASSHADLVSTERLPLPDAYVQGSVHIVKVAPR